MRALTQLLVLAVLMPQMPRRPEPMQRTQSPVRFDPRETLGRAIAKAWERRQRGELRAFGLEPLDD